MKTRPLNARRLGSLLLTLTAFAPTVAQAQVGHTGAISTRSDVRMSIEGELGTSGKKIEALAKGLDRPLFELKRCYSDLVKDHPEVTGTLVVELGLPEGKKSREPELKLASDEPLNRAMQTCVSRSFKSFEGKDVPRPAKARILLELTNSAAGNVADVRAKEEDASRVEVKPGAAGGFFSEGKSMQGEVSFRVESRDKGTVEAAHGAVRASLPALFDCRRRAGKKTSPEGELVFAASLTNAGPKLDVSSCTVQAPNAPNCVTRALTEGLRKVRGANAKLTIHFHP